MKIPSSQTQQTLLGSVLKPPDDDRATLPLTRFFMEGFLFTGFGVAVMFIWRLEHGGVFSIFLAAAALNARFSSIITRNRENIWSQGKSSWDSNRETALQTLMLFLGITAAYSLASVVVGEAKAQDTFRFALEAAHIGQDTILDRRFGNLGALLLHNGQVMVSVFVLAFIYRGYGALLVLGWNASVWGIVLTFLVARGVAVADGGAVLFVITAALAVLPHLLVEATAYVLGTLAAIFVSKALVKYEVGSEPFRSVSKAAGLIFLAGLLLLVIAAGLETLVAPLLLGRL